MGQTFPHCLHSSRATMVVAGDVDESGVLDSLQHAYQELESFEIREDKLVPGCGECWRISLMNDAQFAGSVTTPGCGWVDYQYWHLPARTDYGTPQAEVEVFSHSSNCLCGYCPHVIRLCCASFWCCFGDSGNNQRTIQQVVDHINQRKSGSLNQLTFF